MPVEISLSELPPPEVITEISTEQIVEQKKQYLIDLLDDPELEDVKDSINIESGPIVTQIQASAYDEYLMRQHINHVYRANLLYYGQGGDLDHTADEHGVERLDDESDADLKTRVRIKNRGSSSAGPDDWWRFYAMEADERVEDVAINRVTYPIPAPGEVRGTITLSILAQTDDGVPSQEILDNVFAYVNPANIRGTTTGVIVVPATTVGVDIDADIWLEDNAQDFVFDNLEAHLRAEWSKKRGLAVDVEPSWISATLQRDGVKRVQLNTPTTPYQAASNEAPFIQSLNLTRKP
jgi:phage-related baseplate assembly protein